MKLFENKVGRPSNKILKKRKMFYLLVTLFFIVSCGSLYALTNNNLNKLKASASSKCIIENIKTGSDTADFRYYCSSGKITSWTLYEVEKEGNDTKLEKKKNINEIIYSNVNYISLSELESEKDYVMSFKKNDNSVENIDFKTKAGKSGTGKIKEKTLHRPITGMKKTNVSFTITWISYGDIAKTIKIYKGKDNCTKIDESKAYFTKSILVKNGSFGSYTITNDTFQKSNKDFFKNTECIVAQVSFVSGEKKSNFYKHKVSSSVQSSSENNSDNSQTGSEDTSDNSQTGSEDTSDNSEDELGNGSSETSAVKRTEKISISAEAVKAFWGLTDDINDDIINTINDISYWFRGVGTDGLCGSEFSQKLGEYWNILMISLPFLFILLCSTDFMKVIIASNPDDLNKTITKCFKRVLYMAILMVLPALFNTLLGSWIKICIGG